MPRYPRKNKNHKKLLQKAQQLIKNIPGTSCDVPIYGRKNHLEDDMEYVCEIHLSRTSYDLILHKNTLAITKGTGSSLRRYRPTRSWHAIAVANIEDKNHINTLYTALKNHIIEKYETLQHKAQEELNHLTESIKAFHK